MQILRMQLTCKDAAMPTFAISTTRIQHIVNTSLLLALASCFVTIIMSKRLPVWGPFKPAKAGNSLVPAEHQC